MSKNFVVEYRVFFDGNKKKEIFGFFLLEKRRSEVPNSDTGKETKNERG